VALVTAQPKTANFLLEPTKHAPLGRGLACFQKGASRCLGWGALSSRPFGSVDRAAQWKEKYEIRRAMSVAGGVTLTVGVVVALCLIAGAQAQEAQTVTHS